MFLMSIALVFFTGFLFSWIAKILRLPPLLGMIAAVSPAVIVPRMIMMQEKGLGTQKGIPQMIMAGASVDDVFVIVMFTAFSSIAAGEGTSWWSFASIPVSIIVGAFAGGCVGVLFGLLCSKIHMRDSVKALLILCFALFAVAAQQLWGNVEPFSGLIAVMAFGMAFRKKKERLPRSDCLQNFPKYG